MLLTKNDVVTYLNRLHINQIEEPTFSFLKRLHEAHVQYISWQTLAIFTNKKLSMNAKDSISLLLDNRSSYCFHLNHAFYHLLKALGYEVSIHSAGVHSNNKTANLDGYHVGLIVHLEEGIHYLVDVGLGDMPLHPVLIKEGSIQQGFSKFQLGPSSVSTNAIRLSNDKQASYLGVDYALEETNNFLFFYDQHEFYSNSVQSPWRNLLLFKNRTNSIVNELKGCIFTTIDDTGIHQVEVHSKQMWLDLIRDVFYEQLLIYSSDEIHDIWLKVKNEHVKWMELTKH